MSSTSVKSPESQIQENIPEEYQEFMEVFSKVKTTGLPSHQSYDCMSDLLPGGRCYINLTF